jgi:hypothetical protein
MCVFSTFDSNRNSWTSSAKNDDGCEEFRLKFRKALRKLETLGYKEWALEEQKYWHRRIKRA